MTIGLSVWALAGCGGPTGVGDTGASSAAWAPDQDPWDPAEPEWGPADIEARVASTFEAGIPTPVVPDAAFEDLLARILAEGAPGADAWSEADGTTLAEWEGEGSLADGSAYDGLWRFVEHRQQPSPDSEQLYVHLFASLALDDAGRGSYVMGGASTVTVARQGDGSLSVYTHIGGLWACPGCDGWVATDDSVAMDLSYDVDGESVVGTLDGGLSGDVTLYADALAWDSGICDGLPTGELLVRDPTGWWHSVVLADDCTGCGEVTWNGRDLGEACVGETIRDAVARSRAQLETL